LGLGGQALFPIGLKILLKMVVCDTADLRSKPQSHATGLVKSQILMPKFLAQNLLKMAETFKFYMKIDNSNWNISVMHAWKHVIFGI